MADVVNAFFEVGCEVALRAHEAVVAEEGFQVLIRVVDVVDCVVNTVLADILTRELVSILNLRLNRHSVMHKIKVFLIPSSHISHKPIHKVSLRHRNS